MTLNDYKQLDFIIADELNVHNIRRILGKDENGNEISLNYNKEENDYYYIHKGIRKECLEETKLKILSSIQKTNENILL